MILLVVLAILAYFGYATYRNRSLSDADETTMRQYTTILPKVDDADEDEDTTLPLDRIGSSFESLDWLNQITRVCWPYIGKIVEKELGPTAEPMINMALPTPFKNFRFLHAKLGKDYLVVDRVTVHKRNKTSVTLDLDVSFKGKPDITMSVSPVPTPFGIEELRWHGRLSVLLKPLVPVLPCVGAVQAAFITHPDLEIEFSGVAAIADFGPIEKIVNNVLHDVIAGMFVLPNRFLMKLNDAIDYFKVYDRPLGAIRISVVQGRGFQKERKAKLIKLTPDCYARVKFGQKKVQTHYVQKSLTPVWNFSQSFVVWNVEQPLVLQAYDWDPVSDDLLGEVTIFARDLILNPHRWTRLNRNVDAVVAADAEIELKSQMLKFSNILSGELIVSVLIDRVTALPEKTKSAHCTVRIGDSPVMSTPPILKPEVPIPGVDPVNPIFSFSFDEIVNSLSEADVVITAMADKQAKGSVRFNAADLQSLPGYTKEGVFRLQGGAEIRAKVVLRGLMPYDVPSE